MIPFNLIVSSTPVKVDARTGDFKHTAPIGSEEQQVTFFTSRCKDFGLPVCGVDVELT